MKAYVVERANGPFKEVDIQRPKPSANQVLVKIFASGVNPLDIKIRAGQAEHAQQPLPAVLGLDMAGVVESVGSAVTTFRPGDEVFGMVGGVGGLQGTLAEFVAADAALLAHKPKELTMQQAAVMPLVTITAWEGIVRQAKVQPGQTVLIHAGVGGVGYAAVQIAVSLGAKVYATASQEKHALVEALGATAVDRYAPANDYVDECTAGAGFDVVYDTIGGAVLDASFIAVKRDTGRVVSCLGWGTHSLAPLSFRSASYSGVFTLFPLLSGLKRARQGSILTEAAKLVGSKQLHPLLADQQFGPDEIAAAHDSVARGTIGKVAVRLTESI